MACTIIVCFQSAVCTFFVGMARRRVLPETVRIFTLSSMAGGWSLRAAWRMALVQLDGNGFAF